MDCSVLLLWAFILRWKRVCIAHNNCMSCPSIWATLSALLINILLGSFQLFLHSDQPLSEGEIITFSSVCQSGEAALSAGGGGMRTDWQTVTATDGDNSSIITQSIIFSFSIQLTPSCILHQTQQHHFGAIPPILIAAFASFSSLAFLSRWAL